MSVFPFYPSCPNMAILAADEDDALDEDKSEDQREELATQTKMSHRFKKQKVNNYIHTPSYF